MAKRRPSGDGMVRKREDGRWEGRIVVGHKKNGDPIHRYVLARTQKELIVKLHDCIEMYRDADLTEDSNMTLGEWLDRWINEYMIFTIRESTLDSYKAMTRSASSTAFFMSNSSFSPVYARSTAARQASLSKLS